MSGVLATAAGLTWGFAKGACLNLVFGGIGFGKLIRVLKPSCNVKSSVLISTTLVASALAEASEIPLEFKVGATALAYFFSITPDSHLPYSKICSGGNRFAISVFCGFCGASVALSVANLGVLLGPGVLAGSFVAYKLADHLFLSESLLMKEIQNGM
jgi:hypothetical protein